MRFCERYEAEVEWVSAETHRDKVNIVSDTEIAISAAKAGIRILDAEVLQAGGKLIACADTNAVPPSGIEGIGVNDKAVPVDVGPAHFLSIGPLAIGSLKYKTQFGLYRQIQTSPVAAQIDFPEAYAFALNELAQGKGS